MSINNFNRPLNLDIEKSYITDSVYLFVILFSIYCKCYTVKF